ncbi:integrase arm-type DNA-binding domain-containing protein [Oxalobacter sp. OttesenSCG-928-P03]|nr:integrase arm-type DNA-binding domain-containing protein [Oxalobacter sp. OttesenSCG-928-P03]
MARMVKPLTAVQIKNAKSKEKAYRLYDGGGLYLEVTPIGSKLWRMKIIGENGKENRLSFGIYPDVSLEQAREKRDEARKLRASGIDPVLHRKAKKAAKESKVANTFEVIAREWFSRFSPNWTKDHGDRIMRRFERDIFPFLGDKPISEVSAPDLLTVLRGIENRGRIETAHRARGNCAQVFRYAISTGRITVNPADALIGSLPPIKKKHFAAVTDPKQVAELLRMIDGYTGSFIVACALKIAPYVFARPGELRKAEWADMDLDAGEWQYTVTKTNTPHVVPLAEQVVVILRELHALTGRGRYVFPSARTEDRPMSDNAILAALRRMGIPKDEMTGHGFRAMARTILDEVLGERIDLIEHQLAHAVRDPNGRAYNRTAHLPERKRMMQRWADYLDELKAGAKVIPFSDKVA